MGTLKLRVNEREHEVRAAQSTPLVYVLRNELGLTGTKLGCGLEQCGACAVLADGKATLTCNAPVGQFSGQAITTVEDDRDPLLQEVKRAFVDAGAAQCGYCIPGMVIAVTGLIRQTKTPSESQVRAALRQHLCRCGTHARVMAAVRQLIAGARQ